MTSLEKSSPDSVSSAAPTFNDPLILLSIVAVVLGVWVPLMFRGLWVDETVSYWVIKDGFRELFSRTREFQGPGLPFYLTVWLIRHVLGESEFALRLVSLLLMFVSCGLLNHIARRVLMIDQKLSCSLLFFVAMPDVIFAATNFRAYSMAIFFSLLSLITLSRWLKQNGIWWGALYVVATIGMLYSHFIFASFICVQAIYVLLFAENWRRFALKYFMSLAFIFLALLPQLQDILQLNSERGIKLVGTTPGVADLFGIWFPPFMLFALIIAFGVALIGVRLKLSFALSDSTTRLIFLLSWVLLPALLLYLASLVTGNQLLISRYASVATSGLALLLGYLLLSVRQARFRRIFLFVFALLTLVHPPSFSEAKENWRVATNQVNALIDSPDTVVLAATGLMESIDKKYWGEKDAEGYLLAPFSYYPLVIDPQLIPSNYQSSQAAENPTAMIKPKLEGKRKVIFIFRKTFYLDPANQKVFVNQSVSESMKSWGFEVGADFEYDLLGVIEYTRKD